MKENRRNEGKKIIFREFLGGKLWSHGNVDVACFYLSVEKSHRLLKQNSAAGSLGCGPSLSLNSSYRLPERQFPRLY